MNIIEIILLGLGLSMDAVAVSMVNGLNEPKMKIKRILLIAVFYGAFQTLMPLVGYLAGSVFANFIAKFIPWLALVLLSFIGGSMLVEGIRNKDEEDDAKPLTIKVLLLQAFATAIDALAIGIIFIDKSFYEASLSFIIIGIITFILSFIAVIIGKKFGVILEKKAKILGGLILIAIGLKIFIEYLITLF